jgi:hypothetical protein
MSERWRNDPAGGCGLMLIIGAVVVVLIVVGLLFLFKVL